MINHIENSLSSLWLRLNNFLGNWNDKSITQTMLSYDTSTKLNLKTFHSVKPKDLFMIYGSKYSRMDHVKFLPQILLAPFLNALIICNDKMNRGIKKLNLCMVHSFQVMGYRKVLVAIFFFVLCFTLKHFVKVLFIFWSASNWK